jgi:hypothetical protein
MRQWEKGCVDLQQINRPIPVYIRQPQITPLISLCKLDLIRIRTRHGSQAMQCIQPTQTPAIRFHSDVIDTPVAVKISKAYGEVEQVTIADELRAQIAVDDAHGWIERRYGVSGLVGVAVHVDVACEAFDK